jgi:hypothetical protein
MRKSIWLSLIVSGLLNPILAEHARGQFPFLPKRNEPPRQSTSRRYADVPFQGNLEMSLKARLAQIRDINDLIDELQKNPSFLDLKKLKKGDWKDPKFLEKEGPKLLELFKKWGLVQKQGEGLKLNAEKLDELKNLQKKLGRFKVGGDPVPFPEPDPLPLKTGDLPPFQGGPPGFLKKKRPELPPIGELDEPDKLAEFFKNWMHNLEDSKFGELFKNSPAFQDGLKDLAQAFQKGEGSMWKPSSGFAGALAKWGNPGDLSWLKNSWAKFNNLSMPSIRPRGFTGPKFGGWVQHIPAPMPGVWGAPGAAGGGLGVGMVLLWVGVAVVVLLLLWKFLPQLKLASRPQQPQGWQLGPWPVDPHTISTRAEVVLAFEFLSLLRFGLDVRTWNHRDIASALGTESGQLRAAHDLAEVYELARYTPDEERLPQARVAAARRDLCFLAGLS